MEAYLTFHSRNSVPGFIQFQFISESGSRWSFVQQWRLGHGFVYDYFRIQKATEGLHRFYFADIEVCTVEGKSVLEKRWKGPWKRIEVGINQVELLCALYGSSWRDDPDRYVTEFWGQAFVYKVRLYPVLELLSAETFEGMRELKERLRRGLARDVGALIENPTLDFLNDVVIVSGNVEAKAHKSIVSARSKEFSEKLCTCWNRRKVDGLGVIRLGDAAGPGLFEMMLFLYTTQYSMGCVNMGNLCITAKEMGLEVLQERFLSESVANMTPETALFAVYLAEFHGYKEHQVQATNFLWNNFWKISRTSSGKCHRVFYAGLTSASKRLAELGRFSKMQILKLSFYMMAKIYYGNLSI